MNEGGNFRDLNLVYNFQGFQIEVAVMRKDEVNLATSDDELYKFRITEILLKGKVGD